jgi:uncharacterized membrane protein
MSKQRLAFLDYLRGIAVLWMIQVHVTNQILDPALRSGWWFTILNISNGFVAPAFLFGAGMGLWIALARKADDYLHLGPALLRYLRRLGYILVWAYMLHVPLEALTQRPMGDLSSWLQFDVLQTIVFGSMLCLAIAIMVRSVSVATYIYAALAIAIIAGAPYLMGMQTDESMPMAFRVLVDKTVSPFPLVPWSAYVLAGASMAALVVPRAHTPSTPWWLMGAGTLVATAVMLRYSYGPSMPWDEWWWQGSPELMVFRLGGILAVMGLMLRISTTATAPRILSFLQVMGSESLFMYISHLMIVYGALGAMLIAALGLSQSGYGMVFIAWVVVTAPLAALAYRWRWVRQHHPHWAFRIVSVHVASMLLWLAWVVLG